VETRSIGPKLGERRVEGVGDGMKAEGADSVAMPEVDWKPAVREVQDETVGTDAKKFSDHRGATAVLVGQSGDAVGSRPLNDTDVLEHSRGNDRSEGFGTEGEPSCVSDNERPTLLPLLDPAGQAVERVVDADGGDAARAEFAHPIAVATADIEDWSREDVEALEVRHSLRGRAGLE